GGSAWAVRGMQDFRRETRKIFPLGERRAARPSPFQGPFRGREQTELVARPDLNSPKGAFARPSPEWRASRAKELEEIEDDILVGVAHVQEPPRGLGIVARTDRLAPGVAVAER